MAKRIITINTKCDTLPQKLKMVVNDELQFNTDGLYTVHLPGGVFAGHSVSFDLIVFDGPVPTPALRAVAPSSIKDYVYDVQGKKCGTLLRKFDGGDPPEIVIDSNLPGRRGKKKKR